MSEDQEFWKVLSGLGDFTDSVERPQRFFKQKPILKEKKKSTDSKLLKQSPELLKVLLGRMRQQAVILDEDTIALIDFFDKYLEDYPNQMRIDDSLFYE